MEFEHYFWVKGHSSVLFHYSNFTIPVQLL